jgi:membrane protease YdiL (CAAX protease family)
VAYVVVVPGFEIARSVLGHRPSLIAGHPFIEAAGIVVYAITGWFAWHRLRALKPASAFRLPSRRDVMALVIALVAVELLDRGYAIFLDAVGQGDHVQAGFENFSVSMRTQGGTVLAIALTWIGSAVAGPFTEELISRGLLFGALASRYGIIAGAALSGIVFGALHGDPIFFLSLAVDGMIFALAYAATGNLVVPIVLHGLSNTIAIVPAAVAAVYKM